MQNVSITKQTTGKINLYFSIVINIDWTTIYHLEEGVF